MSNIQTDRIMNQAKTTFIRFWSGASLLLLQISLFAQTPPATNYTPAKHNSGIILMDSENIPLLYTAPPTNVLYATRNISNDPPLYNPRNTFVNGLQDFIKEYTKVDENGQIISTYSPSCPKLLVDVNMPFIQSCISSTAVLTYCNHGGEDAYNTYVEIQIDSNLQLDSASVTCSALAPNRYRLDIGTIATGLCGNINLHLTTACDPTLIGNTHCIDAHIFPDTLCAAIQPSALLEVNGQCLGNQLRFTVRNHSAALAHRHQMSYIIIDDHLIANGQRLALQHGTLSIPSSDKFTITIPVTTPTHMNYKMEIRDAQNAIIAIAFVELCSNNPAIQPISSDFYVHNFWNGSPLPFTDRACAINGKSVINATIGNDPATGNTDYIDDNSLDPNDAPLDNLHLKMPVQASITPNPVGSKATIHLQGAEDAVYGFELYSITGQLVHTLAIEGNSQAPLVRKNLPSGLYVYRIIAKGQSLEEGKIMMK